MRKRRVKQVPSPLERQTQLSRAKLNADVSLGTLLELYRPFLLTIAAAKMDPRLKGKDGASDLVQEAFVIAHRRFAEFQGQSEPEFRQWLRSILLYVVRDWHRRYHEFEKRSVAREQSLDGSASRKLFQTIANRDLRSPGAELEFKDEIDLLEASLKRLPVEHRQVIIWHNYQDRTFVSIGKSVKRSPDAVRMLWNRAIRNLAREMRTSDESS